MRVLVTLLLVPSGFFAFFSAFGLLISFLNGSEQLRNEAFLALLISGTISLILYEIADWFQAFTGQRLEFLVTLIKQSLSLAHVLMNHKTP